jgi:hypothetical protein
VTIRITTKSYPYLAFARDWDVPYWVVLNYGVDGIWGELAAEWLDSHMPGMTRQEFHETWCEYAAFAARSLRLGFAIFDE